MATNASAARQSTACQNDAPRLLLICTGGTIGMVENPRTAALAPADLAVQLANHPKLERLGCQIEQRAFAEPIDSSDMSPAVWERLAHMVADGYDAFDGFVIAHGTDTMAYTASALSFMLQGLEKPVILTGSQLPMGQAREDGTQNLVGALEIAAARDAEGNPRVQEVAVCFGPLLTRGNRSIKASSTAFDAFVSPNFPPLAKIGLHVEFDRHAALRQAAHPGEAPATHTAGATEPNEAIGANKTGEMHGGLRLFPTLDPNVGVLWLHPGISAEQVRAQLSVPGLKGMVVRTYGAGNAPADPAILDALAQATQAGIVLIGVTQCIHGGTEQGRYEAGVGLARAGVIPGFDLTCEAALTKLMHCFGRGLSPAETARLMQTPVAGEMTVPGQSFMPW